MAPVAFLDLPIELLCHILAGLDVPDLMHCTRLNKYLHKVVADSSRLQYIIELSKHRMVPVLPCTQGPSLAVRLKILRERERAWKRLEWKCTNGLDLPNTGSVYEFVGGVYGNGKEDERMVASSIAFFQLPSSDSSASAAPIREWVHTMGDLWLIDFTMDPAQDLLVLVALAPPDSKYIVEVHLRTLSTNEPHPEAPASTLFSVPKYLIHGPQISHSGTSVRVQIAGNLIALLCKEVLDLFGAHMEVWNWRVPPRNTCTMCCISGIDDFCFLSQDTFLTAKPPGKFEVYTFIDPAIYSNTPIMRRGYELPPLSDGLTYWCMSMSCNPVAGYKPMEKVSSAAAVTTPLHQPRSDERINACYVCLFNAEHPDVMRCFVFFVNIDIFLKPSPSGPVTYPWAEWGPSNTRWFSERLSADWEHALYGHRTVDSVACDGENEDENENEPDQIGKVRKRRLRVRDFNPYAVRRCAGGQKEEGWKCKVVRLPSIIYSSSETFKDNVVSWLPYTEVISKEAFDMTDVMMDDSRILLLKCLVSGDLWDLKVLMM